MRLLRTKLYGNDLNRLVLDTFPRMQSDRDPGDPDYDAEYDGVSHSSTYTHDYAILSHTWERKEVLFSDVTDGTAQTKSDGFKKVAEAMTLAASQGFRYIWIDTCCIDKNSSAELSEAINSMYMWYRAAKQCYAYLSEVPSDVDLLSADSAFRRARWWTRGWTLQELLAPKELDFYSCDWQCIGGKHALQELIAQITRIDAQYLTGHPVETASVAKRMSWAAARRTTRAEDAAYCLMGIFSVNMPMLYGEGGRAFYRLQEEIMKHSDDRSLFAWIDRDAQPWEHHGLLAESPAAFTKCSSFYDCGTLAEQMPFNMTNRGLHVYFQLQCLEPDLYLASLDCKTSNVSHSPLSIFLIRLAPGGNQYARVNCNKLEVGTIASIDTAQHQPSQIYVRQPMTATGAEAAFPSRFLALRQIEQTGDSYFKFCNMLYKGALPRRLCKDIASPQELSNSQLRSFFKMDGDDCQVNALLLFEARQNGHALDHTLVIYLGSPEKQTAEVGFHVSMFPTSHTKLLTAFNEQDVTFLPGPASASLTVGGYQIGLEVQVRLNVDIIPNRDTKMFLVDVILASSRQPQGVREKDRKWDLSRAKQVLRAKRHS